MEVQTHSEINGLSFFESLAEAKKAAEIDNTIWKISYNRPFGFGRIRLVKQDDGSWKDEPIVI